MKRSILAAASVAVVLTATLVFSSPASAQDPTVTVDRDEVEIGSSISVELSGFPAGVDAQALLCNTEAPGPTSCDATSIASVPIDETGSASFDYEVSPDPGYDCEPCFLVVIDGIPPTATGVAALTLSGEAVAEPEEEVVIEGGADPLGEPAILVTPYQGLTQDQVVMFELSGFAAGRNVTVSMCQKFPVTGPQDCDLSRFGEDSVMTDENGAARGEYRVDHGELGAITCHEESPCSLVASDGIGPAAVAAGHTLEFAAADGGADADPPVEDDAEDDAADDEVAAVEATGALDSDDGGSSSSVVIIIVVAVVLGIAGGAWFAMRRRGATG